ncbi:hypothetical protein HOO65_030343 [Ceratocystis lukuohia]|uniref:Cell division control protein 16 n=3 Tax=Ceratocystis TaxID=5157 RepID=A0A2C5XE58_9PEZI|nr:Cell division control protein 16 [Ceratocystis fimbriata CBS 114723]
MPSPTRNTHSPFAPSGPLVADITAPAPPRTQRTLRKLQSAHSLGAKASTQIYPATPVEGLHIHHQVSQPSLKQRSSQLPQPSPSAFSSSFHHQTATPPRHQLHHQASQNLHSSRTTSQVPANTQPQKQKQLPQLQSSPLARNGSPQKKDAASLSGMSPLSRRTRANSDANGTVHPLDSSPLTRKPKRPQYANLGMSIQAIVRDGPPDGDYLGTLETARYKILEEGIKSDSDGMSSVRIYAWLILLNTPIMATDDYLALIHRGASPAYAKIRNDTFRTLTTDPLFRRRVSEASLIRLLNAIAWRLHDGREKTRRERSSLAGGSTIGNFIGTGDIAESSPGTDSSVHSSPAAKNRARALTLTTEGSEQNVMPEPGTYVQGMNVLAAPFLYAARSEAEAFTAFYALLTRECPGYIRGAMEGVHRGLALVDKVLAIVDKQLSSYLLSRSLRAEIYAFPSVLTLSACTPPLPEVLKLWDFLFAYGPHLNILCIVAQLYIMRDQILASPTPSNLLRSFPALQAEQIKKLTISFVQRIPRDMYAEIVDHAR